MGTYFDRWNDQVDIWCDARESAQASDEYFRHFYVFILARHSRNNATLIHKVQKRGGTRISSCLFYYEGEDCALNDWMPKSGRAV
jgi:hypothetical protein